MLREYRIPHILLTLTSKSIKTDGRHGSWQTEFLGVRGSRGEWGITANKQGGLLQGVMGMSSN